MAQQPPSLDALVLRGATIAAAVDELGLRDAWNAGEGFSLRGRIVRSTAIVPVPLRGKIRAIPVTMNSRHVFLGLRFAPGSSVVDESESADCSYRKVVFPTRERIAEVSQDPAWIAHLERRGTTIEKVLSKLIMWVAPTPRWNPEGIVYAHEASEPWVQLVAMCGNYDRRLNDVGMTVEQHSAHELTVGLAAPEAPVPRFDAYVLRLVVEPAALDQTG